jgi:streptogramin lyase
VSPTGDDVECADIGTDINAIAAGDGVVWIAATDGQVLRVDPETLEVSDTIDTDGLSFDSIAIAADGVVWITDASANESSVFRIDA